MNLPYFLVRSQEVSTHSARVLKESQIFINSRDCWMSFPRRFSTCRNKTTRDAGFSGRFVELGSPKAKGQDVRKHVQKMSLEGKVRPFFWWVVAPGVVCA